MPAVLRTASLWVFVAGLMLVGSARVALAAEPLLDPASVDWVNLLGPPPAPESRQAQEDLVVVLWVQKTRSPDSCQRVWDTMSPSVATFQQAIGVMLLPEKYPGLYAVVREGIDATAPIFFKLKQRWKRPRPGQVASEVKPCTPTSVSGSYPSGTAVEGIVAGRLLVDLIPERKQEILARAHQIAALRVAAGAHFPSDVEAGIKLGNAIADQILTSEAWAAQRRAAAAEVDRLRPLPPRAED